MTRGRFITLEGGEGVGKTTNLKTVCEFLAAQGIETVVTREPGGTAVGEKIRGIFLGQDFICPETELLLVFAARAQHLYEVIKPALQRGAWVVCDRFTDASFAYQGGGRQLSLDFIAGLEQQVQQGLQPDLTLFLDAPVAIGLARANKRGPVDRMEAETVAFFERVRQTYIDRATAGPARIKTVDAAQPLQAVQAQVLALLQAFLAEQP